MSEDFDGYRKWLGIPPEDQPPNHYRLLGIAAFEDDPDVISNAADRQMAHVRTYQSGKHGDLSQRILNELSSAKVCLLADDKKKSYDDQLRKELADKEPGLSASNGQDQPAEPPPPAKPKPAPPPPKAEAATPVAPPSAETSEPAVAVATRPTIAVPTPVGPATPTPVSVGTPTRSTATARTRRRKQSPLPIILVGVLVAGLAVVAGIAGLILGSGEVDTSGLDDVVPEEIRDIVPDTSTPKGSDKDRPSRGDRNRDNRPRNRPGLGSGLGRPGRGVDGTGPGVDDDPVLGSLPRAGETNREKLSQAIEAARESLASRNVNEATIQIGLVDALKPDNVQDEKAERIRTLYDLYANFWRGVYAGVEDLDAGEEFGIGSQMVEFVSYDDDQITLRHEGDTQSRNIKRIKVVYLVALARRGLDEFDPQTKYSIAAFLALDEGGVEKFREYAIKIYEEASQGGSSNAHLAAELGIDTDDDLASVNPDLSPPDEPGPDDPGPEDGGPPTNTRPSAPPSDQLRAARLKVGQQFRAQIAAATTAEALRDLVKQLIAAAEAERNLATRYVLWEKTRDLTVDLANPEAVMASIDALAADFDINVLEEKSIYLGKTLSRTSNEEVINNIASMAIELKDEAKAMAKRGAAVKLSQVAMAAGRKSGNIEIIREAEAEIQALDEYVSEQKKVERATERLEANPDDPIANFAVGKFICFYDGDWKKGLPMLAKGSNDELGELAERELATTKAAPELKAIADGWVEQARREDPFATATILSHAADLYRQSLPGLSGDQREAVGEQLREISGTILD